MPNAQDLMRVHKGQKSDQVIGQRQSAEKTKVINQEHKGDQSGTQKAISQEHKGDHSGTQRRPFGNTNAISQPKVISEEEESGSAQRTTQSHHNRLHSA